MILVTGCAGFIGAGVARALLARSERVLGLDSFNSYYDPKLKRDRVAPLLELGLELAELDLADAPALQALLERRRPRRFVHLAAQAGVRYSFENPRAYVDSNLVGFVNLLEGARALASGAGGFSHFVYASSSSVYGANTKVPFSVLDPVEQPVSLYAATKRANELIAQVYARQFGLRLTGLRYFTVYGPWGRPDMAPLKFARALLEGRTIEVYGEGDMRRDFTWIDDIVQGTIAALDETARFGEIPHRVYNLGNHRPEELMHFIAVLAKATGREPRLQYLPMQPGDVRATYADITETTRDLGWQPTTSIEEGLPKLVEWVREYFPGD
jgi:UDP-glucuronate 4-epimerase